MELILLRSKWSNQNGSTVGIKFCKIEILKYNKITFSLHVNNK